MLMDSKEDEEITIDFGKIKNFFKSDEKEEKKVEESLKSSPAKEEGKNDEEVSIDFSKIKGWFKSDKPSPAKSEDSKIEHKKNDDYDAKKDDDAELSFDFKKIKKFFKSGERHSSASEDEMSLDWNSIVLFFKKYGVFFIVLIPIILSIYVRMQAGFLPVTDDWAINSVISGVKSQIRSGIDKQFPNLPDSNKEVLVNSKMQEVINQNKRQIDDQIRQTSAYFKAFFQDEGGKNYMPDIDPYYWFRYVKNIVEHGHPGDVLKEGKPYDNHQLAPLGRFVQPDLFHVYFLVYFYKFLHFFAPDLSIMRSMFYYPVFVSAICVLLVFLIARKIAGNAGGFFAGLMMAVNVAFLGRTLFGHADSDAWVVLFPLIVTWLFVSTIDAKSTLKIIIFTVLAGFFSGLFTFAWSGWWYIFDFLLATIATTFVYLVLTSFDEIKKGIGFIYSNIAIRNILIMGIIYFVSTAIFAVLFSDFSTFTHSFLGPLSFPSLKQPVSTSLWPNVLTTVAELNEGSLDSIINSIGGKFLFFISLLGLILAISRNSAMKRFDFVYIMGTTLFYWAYFLLGRFGFDISVFGFFVWIMLPIFLRIGIAVYKKDSSYDFKLAILLSLWVVSTIFASIKGIRFTLLLAPAFSVAFGVALAKIYEYSTKWLTKELKIHKVICSSILIVLLLLPFVNPIRGAVSASGSDLPIVNDAWYNALAAIKQNSSENAIITSWWDFGHHFKAIADRPVTFDGTTQTSPAAHWVGKLLMTDNEVEAAGILRMLDCGSNSAYNELHSINNDTHLSIKILKEIILLSKKEAEKKLMQYGFNKSQIDKILSFSHCNPPEGYFIASEDMIGKSGVWAHFGSWNFERADIWQNARKMPQEDSIAYMMKKFNYTKEKAENIYFEIQAISSDSEANAWVAPWPGYGGTVKCNKKSNDAYLCSNGLQINLSNYDVFGVGQQGIVRPKSAAFTTEDGIFKKQYNGTTLDFAMTIIPKSETELEVILSSKELVGSIFTRMFHMQGHGLRYFKLFNHQHGLTGTDIYTYKMDWDGKSPTIAKEYADYFKKPSEEKNNINIDKSSINNNNINSNSINNSNINITSNANLSNISNNS